MGDGHGFGGPVPRPYQPPIDFTRIFLECISWTLDKAQIFANNLPES
jgi:hypothetical protein